MLTASMGCSDSSSDSNTVVVRRKYIGAGIGSNANGDLFVNYEYRVDTDRMLKSLSLLDDDELKIVRLTNTDATDEGLAHLERLPRLEILLIDGGRSITNTGIENLGVHPHLRELTLLGTQVTHVGVEHLPKLFPNIESLTISGLDDTALAHLPKLQALTSLDLKNCHISDDGADQLGKLNNLRSLFLLECEIKELVVERLKQKLPNCRVRNSNTRS